MSATAAWAEPEPAARPLAAALITPFAASRMRAIAEAVYRARGTEWGGLIWGKRFRVGNADTPAPVTVIAFASNGVCEATPVACEILDASWAAGRREIESAGLADLECVGDFHSHPALGVFLSAHADVPAFWANAHKPQWISMVIDPYSSPDHGVFAQDGADSIRRVPLQRLDASAIEALGWPAWLATEGD